MHDELFDLQDRLLGLVDVEVALTDNDPHIGEIIGAKSQQIRSNISSKNGHVSLEIQLKLNTVIYIYI
jgi:hypothetical protein